MGVILGSGNRQTLPVSSPFFLLGLEVPICTGPRVARLVSSLVEAWQDPVSLHARRPVCFAFKPQAGRELFGWWWWGG